MLEALGSIPSQRDREREGGRERERERDKVPPSWGYCDVELRQITQRLTVSAQ
jgi:hypothetical protein